MSEPLSLVQAIKDYMMTCPFLSADVPLEIDHISGKISFAISFIPANPVVTPYVDGSKLKQKQFLIISRAETPEGKSYIDNQELLEDIQSWFEKQNNSEVYPDLQDPNREPKSISVTSAGYLSDFPDGGEYADYQITCVFLYKQKGVS